MTLFILALFLGAPIFCLKSQNWQVEHSYQVQASRTPFTLTAPLPAHKIGERELYPQEGEVSVVLNAGNLQVAHDHLTVLVVFP